MARKFTERVLIGFTPDQIAHVRDEAKIRKVTVTALVRTIVDKWVLTQRAERHSKP
jgi:hypothetical protein